MVGVTDRVYRGVDNPLPPYGFRPSAPWQGGRRTDRRRSDQVSVDRAERDASPMTTETRTPSPDITVEPPTTHARLASWVHEVAALTQPDRVHWCTGDDEEWTALTDQLVAAGTFTRLDRGQEAELVLLRVRPDRRRPGRGPHLHLLARRGGRRRHEQLDGPGRDEGDHDRALPRARCAAGRCTSSRSAWVRSTAEPRCSASRSPTRRTSSCSMRIMARMGADGPATGWASRRRLRALPALGRRAARARPAGRAVAVQRHEVHHPVPRGADDLELRLRLRRQRAARQEVLLAAHRLGDGAATRAGSPSTC